MNSQDIEVQRSSSDFWFACVDIDVVRDSSLSLTVRGIYAIICSYASITNRSCWPTVETLAKDAGVSASTVQRALKELSDRGIITRQERFEEKRQISSKILIVGFHASCYNEPEGVAPMTGEGSTHDTRGVAPMTDRTIPKNDIYYSKEGADLPNSTESEKTNELEPEINPKKTSSSDNEKNQKNVDKAVNPDSVEKFTPDYAPKIMKATVELLLLKTGRKYLSWDEIMALRELAGSQMPARVQKEIDTACERFKRQGKPLTSLRFEYIASALRNQPTRGKKAKNKSQSENVKPSEIRKCTDAQAEAEMARIEELQAKFDEEARRRRANEY